jgi:hypothetical protein
VDQAGHRPIVDVDVARAGDAAVAGAERDLDQVVVDQRQGDGRQRRPDQGAAEDHPAVAAQVITSAAQLDGHGAWP